MDTLILEKPSLFRLEQTERPTVVEPGYARVKVRSIGICGTDISSYKGYYAFLEFPRILGHELGVEVLEVNDDNTSIKEGDLCAVVPYITCGKCQPCLRGMTNCCENLLCLGVHTDGGMREEIMLPTSTLHRSSKLKTEALALVEMLGVGKHAVDRAGPKPNEIVAILGLGPIGLSAAQFANLSGAKTIGLDISDERAKACKNLMSIETMSIDPDMPIDEYWKSNYGELPDIVIDATGNPKSMQGAFSLPMHGGKLVFVGLMQGSLEYHIPTNHRREMNVLNSRNCVGQDFREIIDLMEQGRIQTDQWISHRVAMRDAIYVFPTWLESDSGLIKGLFEIDA